MEISSNIYDNDNLEHLFYWCLHRIFCKFESILYLYVWFIDIIMFFVLPVKAESILYLVSAIMYTKEANTNDDKLIKIIEFAMIIQNKFICFNNLFIWWVLSKY